MTATVLLPDTVGEPGPWCAAAVALTDTRGAVVSFATPEAAAWEIAYGDDGVDWQVTGRPLQRRRIAVSAAAPLGTILWVRGRRVAGDAVGDTPVAVTVRWLPV